MDKQHALEEFLKDCKEKDSIKAKVVIDYLAEIAGEERRRILFELVRQEDDFAIPVLAYLIHKHPDLIAANPQLQQSMLEKAMGNPSQVLKNLLKIAPETSVLVELAAKIRLKEALPRLRQFLNQSDDERLLEVTLRTLGELGDTQAIAAIAEFLASLNSKLQAAAIQALGEIGTDGSLNTLFAAIEKLPPARATILELFKEVQSEAAIRCLNQTLVSADTELRILGKAKLIELGVKAVPLLTRNLTTNHPDLQIHTLNILQEIGDQSAVKAVRQLLNTEPENDNVRFAAYETLAHLPNLKGDYLLATGLTDRDDSIRLAAAKAIDKNLDAMMLGGIKNMVKNETAEAVRIIKAIIDAEAGEMFSHLLAVPFFHRIAIDYIAAKVHPTVRFYFLEILKKQGRSELADQVEQKANAAGSRAIRKVICAVDDSVMILSVYRRVLNELGYEPVLFEYPEKCLFWLADNKPAAVFTDLNMPILSGLELARRIREQYDVAALPIIMVTTQQDGKDEAGWQRSGINQVINKPFDSESIKKALTDLSIMV